MNWNLNPVYQFPYLKQKLMSCIFKIHPCYKYIIGTFFLSGASVLVHGSEGLDTTLQVTSLAQLLLDHDCRTVRG